MDTSGYFQLISFDSHRQRALETLDRDHEAFDVTVDQDPFHPIQAATANAYALPGSQKCMQGAGNIFLQQASQMLHLFTGDGNGLAMRTHETQHAGGLQHLKSGSAGPIELYKRVTGEKRHTNCFVSVTPGSNFFALRQKCFNS